MGILSKCDDDAVAQFQTPRSSVSGVLWIESLAKFSFVAREWGAYLDLTWSVSGIRGTPFIVPRVSVDEYTNRRHEITVDKLEHQVMNAHRESIILHPVQSRPQQDNMNVSPLHHHDLTACSVNGPCKAHEQPGW